ncbi:MAG: hypothetical protein PVH73_05550 [Candidatus Bathyarchaeota archaeon]|jgi:hypothetical protein
MLKLVGREIVEVLYSPVKAFKKIIEKPDFKGVLLILLLVIASTVVFQFVYNSRQLYENRAPQNDNWTEALTNSHSWVSNGLPSLDAADHKMGNSSVTSSAPNATSIWLNVAEFDSINCSGEKGYNEMFFWIKWVNEAETVPSSGTLRLFSGSEDSYFESTITEFSSSSGEWTNATLKVGSDQEWSSTNSPDWQNITGIEFNLVWLDSANLTMNVDGLFFRNYVSPIEALGFSVAMFSLFVSSAFSIAMNWILWAGVVIIIAKLFGEELGRWNVLFVIIGHAFIVVAVYTLVSALAFSSLPVVSLPLDYDLQIAVFNEVWLPNLAYQAGTLILWAGEIWIAALSAVVIRLMKNTTWGKAATIAAVAFAVRFVLRLFIG